MRKRHAKGFPCFVRATIAIAIVCFGASVQAAPRSSDAEHQPLLRHVFLIVLENKTFRDTFGPDSAAPYLAKTLPASGALLEDYYGIGHFSLDNYVALVSGQAPNPETQQDCHLVTEFTATYQRLDSHGQMIGSGCIYPLAVKSLPDQLQEAGLAWKGYMEDFGLDRLRDRNACTATRIGRQDPTERATGFDEYASKHNPFVYFHSVIDNPVSCRSHVVALDKLTHDLRSIATTPNFSFITPDLCHDGHDPTCDDGKPGGLSGINGFLSKWVPLIMRSPAFRKDGLLVITFDESDGAPPDGADACCGETALPQGPPPGVRGPGGGRVGAVALSRFIVPGTVSTMPYNHYSLLRTVEDIFGLEHLGYAAQSGLRPFGSDVYTRH